MSYPALIFTRCSGHIRRCCSPRRDSGYGSHTCWTADRELYNAALEERIGVWRWERRSVSRLEQFRCLTGWEHPVLEFGVCPARGSLNRLDGAFQGFYRRCRRGERPGFPRFRNAARWDSVEYPDANCWKVEREQHWTGRLYIKGVGSIRFRGARRGILGTPKTLTVRREGNRWRITVFCADVPAQRLRPTDRAVGIDVGVRALIATSDGELVTNPRHLVAAIGRLVPAHQLVAGRRAARVVAALQSKHWVACIARSRVSDATSLTWCRADSSSPTESSSMKIYRSRIWCGALRHAQTGREVLIGTGPVRRQA